MSRATLLLALAALATGPLFPAPAGADAAVSSVPHPAGVPVPTVWTEPPVAVRAAAAALRDACVAWSRRIPLPPASTDLSAPRRGEPAEAVACDAALDPFGHKIEPMVLGALFAAAVAGAALGTYATAAALLRLLRGGVRRTATAARELRPRRRQGWQE